MDWWCWQRHWVQWKQIQIHNKCAFQWGQITASSLWKGIYCNQPATRWLAGSDWLGISVGLYYQQIRYSGKVHVVNPWTAPISVVMASFYIDSLSKALDKEIDWHPKNILLTYYWDPPLQWVSFDEYSHHLHNLYILYIPVILLS